MENTHAGGISHGSTSGFTGGSAPGSDIGSSTGRGEAADGQIQATATRGHLQSLELNPRLMRLSGEQLARYVAAAIDAAIDEARRQVAPAAEAPPVDPRVLAARLSQVHDQGARTVQMITEALGDAMALLRERTGMDGDISPRGLPELLDQTRRTVEQLAGPPGANTTDAGDDTDEVSGRGEAVDGQVHAVTTAPDGRLTTLDIGDTAMRMASHELAAQIRVAVNAALADLKAKLRERSGFSPVDPDRLAALREAGTQQMTAYARSLRDLVAGLKPR